MKSLLVDALRSAQGEKTDNSPDEDAAELPAIAQNDGDAAPARLSIPDEMSLLATGVYESQDREIAEYPESGEQEESIRGPEDDKFDEIDRDSFGDTDVAAVDDEPEVLSAPIGREPDTVQPRTLLAKIARLSPAICLLTMSAAAGAFVLYQNLAARQLNRDLSELSEHIQLDRFEVGNPSVPMGGPAAPTSSDSVTLIPVGHRYAPVRESSSATVATKSTPVNEQVQSAAPANSPHVIVNRSNRAIDDAAFEQVRTAYAAYERGEHKLAERDYRRALEIAPNHLNALAGLAAVLQETGRSGEALVYYRQLLNVEPNNEIAAAAIIASDRETSAVDAIPQLKSLLQHYPNSAYLHYVLGVRYLERNLWPEASLSFLNAHNANPGRADYSYNLAVSLERLGDYESAEFYFERAILSAGNNDDFNADEVRQHIGELAAMSGESS